MVLEVSFISLSDVSENVSYKRRRGEDTCEAQPQVVQKSSGCHILGHPCSPSLFQAGLDGAQNNLAQWKVSLLVASVILLNSFP